MESLLYIMKLPLHETYTLKQKFLGQILSLENMGIDVYYFTYDERYIYLNHGDDVRKFRKCTLGNNSSYSHTLAFIDIYLSVIKLLRQKKFNYVYFRKYPIGLVGYLMCKRIHWSNAKFIVEVPTYPEGERAKNFSRRLFSRYSSFFWLLARKNASLFALIGEETKTYHGCPAVNIDNGIFVDLIPRREPFSDGKIHMLALASMTNWHGYDRIIESLSNYNGEYREKVIIDMVGDEGDGSLQKWKKLTEQLGLEKQVIFHGRKEGDELTRIFNISTIGICSLGMYRNGFHKGSILKLREFTARGLPFIFAAEDPCIDQSLHYSLKVPNDDSKIDFESVVSFALEVSGNSHLSDAMREYAKANMTWETQFNKIFSKVNSLTI